MTSSGVKTSVRPRRDGARPRSRHVLESHEYDFRIALAVSFNVSSLPCPIFSDSMRSSCSRPWSMFSGSYMLPWWVITLSTAVKVPSHEVADGDKPSPRKPTLDR